MTIQEAKNKIAKNHGYENWGHVITHLSMKAITEISFITLEDEAMQLYSEQFSEPSKSLDREELFRWVEEKLLIYKPKNAHSSSDHYDLSLEFKDKLLSLPHKEDKRLEELKKWMLEISSKYKTPLAITMLHMIITKITELQSNNGNTK